MWNDCQTSFWRRREHLDFSASWILNARSSCSMSITYKIKQFTLSTNEFSLHMIYKFGTKKITGKNDIMQLSPSPTIWILHMGMTITPLLTGHLINGEFQECKYQKSACKDFYCKRRGKLKGEIYTLLGWCSILIRLASWTSFINSSKSWNQMQNILFYIYN